MARDNLTTRFLREVFAQETGICPVFLLTITHPALTDPILVSSDPTERLSQTAADIVYGTRSRGKEFVFFPFTLTLPSDEDEGPQNMQLTLDNVLRQYTDILRSIVGPPTLLAELVLADMPDTVEAYWPEYLMNNVKYDAQTITVTLALETLQREPFPALTFNPSYFPGLY